MDSVSVMCILTGLGKWRYLITGCLLACFLYSVCRLINSLTAPFGMWRRFSGICAESADGAVCAEFQDAQQLTHRAAFRLPPAMRISAGDTVRFAVRTDCFHAGSYPQSIAALPAADAEEILHISAYRRLMLHTLLRKGITGILFCGISLAAFLTVMKYCFSGS